jgi:acyl-CoA thioester hydrolase
MGYVYYGNYAAYFEVARVEAIRALGISYAEVEEQGVLMPVSRYEIKYLFPAFYDEELTIVTEVRERPRARVTFYYLTYNNEGRLINEALTEMCFINRHTNRPQRAPQTLVDAWEKVMGPEVR